MRRSNVCGLAIIVLLAVTVWPASALAQAAQGGAALKPEALVGTYQGTAIGPGGGEMPVTITLKYEKATFTGGVKTGEGQEVIPITAGTLSGDRLVLNLDMAGSPATLTCTVKGSDRLEGNWTAGDAAGTVVLTRAPEGTKPVTGETAAAKPADAANPPAEGAAPSKPAAAAGADPLTGSWDGVTGNGDMSVPFTMNLKLEGEKVTGDISSEQGGTTFTPGVFKDGALSITFDFNGMAVTMVGALKEGKLVGTMDFAGQMQMSWAAVKK